VQKDETLPNTNTPNPKDKTSYFNPKTRMDTDFSGPAERPKTWLSLRKRHDHTDKGKAGAK